MGTNPCLNVQLWFICVSFSITCMPDTEFSSKCINIAAILIIVLQFLLFTLLILMQPFWRYFYILRLDIPQLFPVALAKGFLCCYMDMVQLETSQPTNQLTQK